MNLKKISVRYERSGLLSEVTQFLSIHQAVEFSTHCGIRHTVDFSDITFY